MLPCRILLFQLVPPFPSPTVSTSLFSVLSMCVCFVTKLCPTLCDPMNCSTLGFPVFYYLPKFAQIHVHWVSDAIQPSHPLLPPSPFALNLCRHQGLFQWVFVSGGQSIGVSASVSVLPMNIQGWFPLGLTGLISLPSRDSQESSPAPQFKSINSSLLSLFLWSTSHIYTWLLEKP